MKKPLVVLDSNVLVSSILIPTSIPGKIISLAENDHYSLVTSSYILKEVEYTLKNPKITSKYSLPTQSVKKLINLLSNFTIDINLVTVDTINIRDPKDLSVLATALTAKANYLVTGDKDLLALNDDPQLHLLEIISPSNFLSNFSTTAHSPSV